VGVQYRADGKNVGEVWDGHGGMPPGDSQSEVTAQGKTDDDAGPAVGEVRDEMGGSEYLVNQGAVKKAFVQMMAVSVVPQVEAENVKISLEEVPPRVPDVGGLRASFPPVKKKHEASRFPSEPARQITPESDTVSRVDDLFRGTVGHRVFAHGPDPEA